MGTIKTDRFIREICKDIGGLKHYNKVLSYLLLAIKDLSIFTIPYFREACVSVNHFNAIVWPEDCIHPIAVGMNVNGRILVLDVDPDIVRSCHLEQCHINHSRDYFQSTDYECFGTGSATLGEWYGIRSNVGIPGYIKHDKNQRLSYVLGDLNSCDELVMFYKSDGLEDCPTELPSEIESALMYFVLHRYELIVRPTVAEVHRKNYKEEVTRLRKFYQSSNATGWLNAFRKNDKSSPK